jgi:hypothetical protein
VLLRTNLIGLWKESINSNGQQFHQYQQNMQSPLSLARGRFVLGYCMLKFKFFLERI